MRVRVRQAESGGEVGIHSDPPFADGLMFMTEAGAAYQLIPAERMMA
jgi:hypothetical protein